MIKACIFDLDGVIVDTAKYHYLAWKRLATEKLDFNFTEHQNERLKGVSRMASLDILLELSSKNISQEDKIAFASKKNSWYIQYVSRMTPEEILPGVMSFLTLLKETGIKIGLGSASKNAGLILKQINMGGFFDAVIDGNHVTKANPYPDVFLIADSALQTPQDECAVFVDAASGVEAAKNGGMTSIGVGSPEILGRADLVISGFKDIGLDLLDRFR